MEAGLTKKWEIRHQLNFPESAVYDQERDVIYVSNNLKGQMEFLSKLSTDGKIIELEWVKGLRRPTGICMNGGMVFVVERPGIAIIDPNKGEITKRIKIEGAVALDSKEVITLATIYPGAIMDGIQPVSDGRVLFTDNHLSTILDIMPKFPFSQYLSRVF